MAETQNAGTSAAGANPAFDPAAFAESLTRKIGSHLSEALKPLVERFEKFEGHLAAQKQPAPAAGETAPKPITMDDVTGAFAKELDKREAQNKSTAQRQGYIAEKMRDIPEEFLAPLGNDPAKWADQEQSIRTRVKSVMGASEGASSEGGAAGAAGAAGGRDTTAGTGGGAARPRIDRSKMTVMQRLDAGLEKSVPANRPK